MRPVVPVCLMLAACQPPDPAEACASYAAALAACYDEAGGEPPAGVSEAALCTEDDGLDGDAYTCLTRAAEAGDCASDRGLVELAGELDRCL